MYALSKSLWWELWEKKGREWKRILGKFDHNHILSFWRKPVTLVYRFQRKTIGPFNYCETRNCRLCNPICDGICGGFLTVNGKNPTNSIVWMQNSKILHLVIFEWPLRIVSRVDLQRRTFKIIDDLKIAKID